MFSGLIQTIGELRETRPSGGGFRISIACTLPGDHLTDGESVAVSGACLTVQQNSFGFLADVSPETLSRTTISRLRPGHRVNLERALRYQDRIGGHFVLGHVDTTGRVVSVRGALAFRTLRIALTAELAPEVAEKGSIAVDGVSLTVVAVGDGWFEVVLIPTTLQATTLDTVRTGELVNIESDVLAKYVRRVLGGRKNNLEDAFGGSGHAQD